MENRFAQVPQEAVRRSSFLRKASYVTSYNVGELVPFMGDEVLPGDTFELKMAYVARLSTLIAPVMDDLYVDIYGFYVPNRIIGGKGKEFMGENVTSSGYQQVEVFIPFIKFLGGVKSKMIADYMGLPLEDGVEVSMLPFFGYVKIGNEWFRDQNLQEPLLEGYDVVGDRFFSFINDKKNYARFGVTPLLRVNKYHDYFTSCLPAPQKGEDVVLSMSLDLGRIPVETDSVTHSGGTEPLRWNAVNGNPVGVNKSKLLVASYRNLAPGYYDKKIVVPEHDSNGDLYSGNDGDIKLTNLYAKPSDAQQSLEFTINELRLAVQTQRMLERDARSGTRYAEILKAHFGVESPDARQQRPEFLGGAHDPFRVNTVIQTSSTNDISPLGHTSAYGHTVKNNLMWKKSFTEHGMIFGLVVVRHKAKYDQGIEKKGRRRDRLDFYLPVFANIGEQPVFTSEIYFKKQIGFEKIFGYQEAWAEYRYLKSLATGDMRTQSPKSLKFGHYGIEFDSEPVLNEEFVVQDSKTVDRVLSVSHTVSDQIIMDLYVQVVSTRPMPMFSIPGKLDGN